MTPAKGAFASFAILFTAMAIIPPAMLGGTEGQIWAFVEKYQTLIAGVLAVAAAWGTVRQMQRSDLKSDLRHQDLIYLALRADRLRVMRLMTPHGSLVDDYLISCRELLDRLRMISSDDLRTDYRAREFLDDVQALLVRKEFAEAKDLFSPEVTFYHEQSLNQISETKSYFAFVRDGNFNTPTAVERACSTALQALEYLCSHLDDLKQALRTMEREYITATISVPR
ncbi:hypothetical protein [Rhizobium sp. Root483D2]|uniref:hypothetical protein n=1 Tax=Rhizobium sp. Root483D2 TaxID=1736545 RepID=UPI0007161D87|nr:hypothetical protein [Rhizobium sp. Root483D2]KQY21024.1 hypothetical protein ASD32_06495 [Rhizobium sp. Root483D2]